MFGTSTSLNLIDDIEVHHKEITTMRSFCQEALELENVDTRDRVTFYERHKAELGGRYVYSFDVIKGDVIWTQTHHSFNFLSIYRRLKDFLDLAAILQRNYQKPSPIFPEQTEEPDAHLLLDLAAYLNNLKTDRRTLDELMHFIEESGHQYRGIKKYKQMYMLKQAGGRYHESCLKCGALLKIWKHRYFIITGEGVLYKDDNGEIKQYIPFGYDTDIRIGEEDTGLRKGILIISSHRELLIEAQNYFDYLQFIFFYKLASGDNIHRQRNLNHSFAPLRRNCDVTFFVDAENYFESVLQSLQQAKREIFMTDWWMSPQLYLIRPINAITEQFRLDRVLDGIAKKGVKINILVYRESVLLTNDSAYTKGWLEGLDPNIKVLRHPNTLVPFPWSHHQKIIVIDQQVGFVGGIDLCYGRWDTNQHPIFDPTGYSCPGIDYNNARRQDIDNVREYNVNHLPKDQPRLPWHDVSCKIVGDAVYDLAYHFIQYWNYANMDIQIRNREILVKITPDSSTRDRFRTVMNNFKKFASTARHRKEEEQEEEWMDITESRRLASLIVHIVETAPPIQEKPPVVGPKSGEIPTGQNLVSFQQLPDQAMEEKPQVFGRKPSGPFSMNILDEKKEEEEHVQKGFEKMIDLLEVARNPGDEKQKDTLKVPGAETDPMKRDNAASSELSLRKQEKAWKDDKSMSQSSILSRLKLAEIVGMILGTIDCQVLRSASTWSIGCSPRFNQNSIQIAYLNIIAESRYFVYIENQFFMSSTADRKVIKNRIAQALVDRIITAYRSRERYKVYILIPLLPGFAGEITSKDSLIMRLQLYWEYQTINRGEHSVIKQLERIPGLNWRDYIVFFGLRNHGRMTANSPPNTQIIYIHSKLMIVDDDVVILGSANINDRSMNGARDSQMCLMSRDFVKVKSMIGGKEVNVSRKARELRVKLFKEHFGLTKEEEMDPIERWDHIRHIARFYRTVFAPYPDDHMRSFEDVERVQRRADISKYDRERAKVRGHVVEFPLQFLIKENLNVKITQKEYIVPKIYAT